jgi:hypothetical protein
MILVAGTAPGNSFGCSFQGAHLSQSGNGFAVDNHLEFKCSVWIMPMCIHGK